MTPAEVRAQLARALPPVTLVLGPGAWDLVTDQAEAAGASDVIAIPALTADAAREVIRLALTAPPGAAPWTFIIRLDDALEAAQQALLMVLDDPPATAAFVLTASGGVLQTVMSRCRVLPLSSPYERELPEEPPDAAEARAAVAAAIRAARVPGRPELLSAAVKGWGPGQARALGLWAQEASTGRWERYGPDFAPGVTAAQALRVLEVLSRYRGARTAPAVALDRVFARQD